MAKGLSGVATADWQDASASVQDAALQAAIADGVVTFVHAAQSVSKQEQLKQDASEQYIKRTSGNAQSAATAGR